MSPTCFQIVIVIGLQSYVVLWFVLHLVYL